MMRDAFFSKNTRGIHIAFIILRTRQTVYISRSYLDHNTLFECDWIIDNAVAANSINPRVPHNIRKKIIEIQLMFHKYVEYFEVLLKNKFYTEFGIDPNIYFKSLLWVCSFVHLKKQKLKIFSSTLETYAQIYPKKIQINWSRVIFDNNSRTFSESYKYLVILRRMTKKNFDDPFDGKTFWSTNLKFPCYNFFSMILRKISTVMYTEQRPCYLKQVHPWDTYIMMGSTQKNLQLLKVCQEKLSLKGLRYFDTFRWSWREKKVGTFDRLNLCEYTCTQSARARSVSQSAWLIVVGC